MSSKQQEVEFLICPSCGRNWDTVNFNACECGATLESIKSQGTATNKVEQEDVKEDWEEEYKKWFYTQYSKGSSFSNKDLDWIQDNVITPLQSENKNLREQLKEIKENREQLVGWLVERDTTIQNLKMDGMRLQAENERLKAELKRENPGYGGN